MPETRHPAEKRMSAREWDDIKRVLAIRLDNIGDVILLGPAIRALKAHAPHVSVTLLASPAGTAVAPLVPGIDDVITYRSEWQSIGGSVPMDPHRFGQMVMGIAKRQFDASIIFTSFSQSPYPPAMAAYQAGIPRRIGQSKEFGGEILTHWVTPLGDSVHQADRNLYLLETTGVPPMGTHLSLAVPEGERKAVDALLGASGIKPTDSVVVAAPAASCQARQYGPSLLAEALAQLAASSDSRIVVAGSEREQHLAEKIIDACPSAISLVGRTSIPQMVALVARASLVIAMNSASLHIADALDIPVLALYSGAEETEQWRPRHAPSVLLNRPVDCSPCHQFTCPRAMECLAVPPAEVAEHALRFLDLYSRFSVSQPETKVSA